MVYERPCRFPDTNSDRLWILLAGRQLTQREWRHWTRVLVGGRQRLLILALITTGLFIPDILHSIAQGKYAWYESAVCLLLFFAAIVLAGISSYRVLREPIRRENEAYALYAADTARHAGGTRIAFYGDRVTATSLRGTATIFFADMTVCLETPEGFMLGDGERWIVIRAQDLMAYDADLVRAYLAERVDPRNRRVKGAVKPHLTQPVLPIPNHPKPVTLTTAHIAWHTTAEYRREKRRVLRLILGIAIPLSVFVAVALTVWVPIVNRVLPDLLYYGAASVVLMGLFARFGFARSQAYRKNKVLEVGFESDGLRVTLGGSVQFCPKERLWLIPEPTGVRIRFANENTLFIPYSAVEDEQVLRALAGLK